MGIQSGTQLGSYEVLSLLGKGGMGEVYRARDAKLKREVAIKILPEEFARDPERVGRFQREAEALAAFNHANIAAIYDLQQANETRFLVMELVEGETLAERLRRGPVPLEETFAIARQIAEALEAAHEKGIVHRDLKPANIKVTPNGKVKVLDFGLAKAFELSTGDGRGEVLSNSPTLMSGTVAGVILGTAAYMSPEQARGKAVDRRADMWAFGCVLYEMLTGRQTFPNGETVTDTLAGVLAREPYWQALPASTPQRIRTLLESCLRKDERRRLRDASYARIEIEEAGNAPTGVIPSIAAPMPRRRERIWTVLALLFLLTAVGAILRPILFPAPAPHVPTVRFEVPMPAGLTLAGQFQLSPDGRKLAFVGASNGKTQIWVRSLDSTAVEPLLSTEGTDETFFWSADSQYIAFETKDQLKKVAVTGGPAQVLCNLPPGLYFGSWSSDGVILLSRFNATAEPSPLLRVSASGGQLIPATELDASRKEKIHLFPRFLPDGRHYFFATDGLGANAEGSYIGTLDSKDRRPLPAGLGRAAQFSASGHVFFSREGTLMAQLFDLNRFQTSGDAFPLGDMDIPLTGVSGYVPAPYLSGLFYSVSTNGDVTYRPGQRSASGKTQLVWLDRKGTQVGIAGASAEYRNPGLSPDGKNIIFERGNPSDIWALDTQRGVATKVTSVGGFPIWSPDGHSIVFVSDRSGTRNLYERAFGMVGEDKLLMKDAVTGPDDWSRDGKYIVFDSLSPRHIWALPFTGERRAVQITQSQSEERGARISPDGRWIAYVSREQGQLQLYIQSFPQPGFNKQVSTNSGFVPRWSRDGSELFYLGPDATVMAVSVKASGSELQISAPVALFKAPIAMTGATRDYDVASDGRFLVNVTNPTATNPSASSMTVILNWPGSFKK